MILIKIPPLYHGTGIFSRDVLFFSIGGAVRMASGGLGLTSGPVSKEG
jgi:hypothetical protein